MSEGGTGRARGRAGRGRSRGAPATATAPVPGAAWGPTPGGAQAPPPSATWGPAPGGAQSAVSPTDGAPVGRGGQSAWGPRPQPQQQAPVQQAPRPQPVTARGKQAAAQIPQPQPAASHQESGLAPGVQEMAGAFRGMQIATGAAGGVENRPAYQKRGCLRGRLEMNKPFITRPKDLEKKQGFSGNQIRVVTNHFRLVKLTDWSLCQYFVAFSPEEDRTSIRKALLRDHKNVIGDGYMFDGAMLFTIKKLPIQKDVLELYSVRESDKEKIRITIKFVNELALGDYQYIQLYNIILRSCIDSMEFQLVGRDYFDPQLKSELRNFRLEIWPGFVTSILQHEEHVMMCLDVSHKVLRVDTVLDLLIECRKRYSNDWQDKFTEAILGMVVFTHYNNKPYRVDDVDFKSNPCSTFLKRNENVKYIDYYQERYRIKIRDMNQPLLVSRPKARDLRGGRDQNIVLIPELCNMTGLSNEMRSNFQLMKAVADKTRIPPAERIKAYYQFMSRMERHPMASTKLSQWNMKFSGKLEEANARKLPPEVIVVGGNGRDSQRPADETGDWTKALRGQPMLSSIRLENWAIIVSGNILDKKGQGMVDNFLSTLKTAANSLRFEMAAPDKIRADMDKPSAYYTAIEKAMSKKQLQLVMCVVANNRTDIYSAIKKKCCVDRPIPSQVIAVKTLGHKNLLSVATKIVIQMNCKLGGAPWYVPLPFTTEAKKIDPTMVVGFDVCHDANMKGKSYGALVASLDYYNTRFYSAVSQHAFGEELSNDIATNMGHAVIRFKEINGHLPSRIFLYRDGVGESNIPFVKDHEVRKIKEHLHGLFPGWTLKMAVIIVSKRIQTRIFHNNDNPKPGTIVDDVVTQPEKYDFFLVSQSVRQGTVTPTSYNVIEDTVHLKADVMQRVTYKMTHVYYNCSCTVRVPAQVQYAHKLAFLVGQAIHQIPNTDLNGQLYFL